jgi:predicted ArsR family transcriptional regulator
LRAKGELSSQDAQREVGLDADAVRPHLQRLVDEGHASTSGQRRGLRYHAR